MQKEKNKDYFLWESFKRGDDNAFFNLYDQYVDMLLGYGLHFSRDVDLLKDCIHDLFLDLYKYRKQLSGTDNIKFYMFRSLKRKIQRELTKKSIFSSDYEGKYAFSVLEPAYDDVIIKTEIKEENSGLLKVAMSKLTIQQREALFLKFEQNLGYSEIAQIQNISVESARTNIYRAIKALRKSLQKGEISLQTLVVFLRNTHIQKYKWEKSKKNHFSCLCFTCLVLWLKRRLMEDMKRQHAEDILTNENISEEQIEQIGEQTDDRLKDEVLLAHQILNYLKIPKFSFSNSEKGKLKNSIHVSIDQLNRRRYNIQRWTSVAAVFVLVFLGGYVVYNRFSAPDIVNFAKNIEEIPQNKETRLLLQGGQEILIKNQESTIQYEKSGENINIGTEEKVVQTLDSKKPVFNTVIVPYGRRSQITLCEGTKVWLNSGSKLVYPAIFEKNKREVYIEGEAIFEVVHAEEIPFFVSARDFTVKVTGTIFNVSAYPDDANSSTVLEQGKIELYSNEKSLLHHKKIKVEPGEIVLYNPDNDSFQQRKINTNDYMSWRKGYYVFKSEKLSSILRKISRYYNVEISSEKQGWLDETFTGSLDFRESPEEVLNLITKTLPFDYKSVNNKISIY